MSNPKPTRSEDLNDVTELWDLLDGLHRALVRARAEASAASSAGADLQEDWDGVDQRPRLTASRPRPPAPSSDEPDREDLNRWEGEGGAPSWR